jgi:L-fuculose-phosphate aldolase
MSLYASAEEIAALYREIGVRGLIVGSSGNVSARSAGGMLITPTGASADTVDADAIVPISLDGEAQGNLAPSSEWEMHAAIYRSCPDAMVIVHTHSDHATALACLNLPLPTFHYGVLEFGGEDVRCAPYVTFGTPELARLAAEAMAGRTACLLANHGMICHGKTAAAALAITVKLETLCRQYLLARTAGTPRLLTDDEIAAARARYRTYGQQPIPNRPKQPQRARR